MLKTIGLPDKLASTGNDGSKLASSMNNDSRPAFGKNNSDSEVDGFGAGKNGIEHAKISRKLSKSRKLKSEKTSKSRNLAKSGKNMSKNGNSTNFNAMENRPKFLMLDAGTTFKC